MVRATAAISALEAKLCSAARRKRAKIGRQNGESARCRKWLVWYVVTSGASVTRLATMHGRTAAMSCACSTSAVCASVPKRGIDPNACAAHPAVLRAGSHVLQTSIPSMTS
jgi:hypothetical protein